MHKVIIRFCYRNRMLFSTPSFFSSVSCMSANKIIAIFCCCWLGKIKKSESISGELSKILFSWRQWHNFHFIPPKGKQQLLLMPRNWILKTENISSLDASISKFTSEWYGRGVRYWIYTHITLLPSEICLANTMYPYYHWQREYSQMFVHQNMEFAWLEI